MRYWEVKLRFVQRLSTGAAIAALTAACATYQDIYAPQPQSYSPPPNGAVTRGVLDMALEFDVETARLIPPDEAVAYLNSVSDTYGGANRCVVFSTGIVISGGQEIAHNRFQARALNAAEFSADGTTKRAFSVFAIVPDRHLGCGLYVKLSEDASLIAPPSEVKEEITKILEALIALGVRYEMVSEPAPSY